MFGAKLNFLMIITNTQNSVLGRAVSLDAAHISRLRRGQRALPKKQAFVAPMSAFFARSIREDYQKKSVCAEMKLEAWPTEENQVILLIEKWLTAVDAKDIADIVPIIHSFTVPTMMSKNTKVQNQMLPKLKSYYYGPTGKREAVLQFFNLILKEEMPQTLLLSSDEEFSWLYEDPVFAAQWTSDFKKVLQKGNRVRIIHATGRDWNEMIQGIAKWVPIYTTGMIEPYYYPRLRDGVCQRTMFIAPKTAAIVSSSVLRQTEGILNELITDKEAICALTLEYENYFSLCRPLMRIITALNSNELWVVLDALLRGDGNLICMSGMPTLASMPEWVAKAMQERMPKSHIFDIWKMFSTSLQILLENYQYTEILPENSNATIQTPLPCAELMGATGLYYMEEELQAHLENAIHLADKYNHYRIVRKDISPNLMLYGKEDRGIIMLKSDAPVVAFTITEANMVKAFWDYLKTKDN